MKCKICNNTTREIIDQQFQHIYHKCDTCEFVFMDEQHYLNKTLELKEYNRHNNSIENEGYVQMFVDFINYGLKPYVPTGHILDYGSGPTPVLKEVLQRMGYEVSIYDPYYSKDQEVFKTIYDAITSTEVFEHFYYPLKEIETIVSLLKENGYLVIMTRFFPKNEADFQNWWYRRDPTHVSFYSVKTFEYIAKKFELELIIHNDINCIVLKKMCKQP